MNVKLVLFPVASMAFAISAQAHPGGGEARMVVGATVVAPCEIAFDGARPPRKTTRPSVNCVNPTVSHREARYSAKYSYFVAMPPGPTLQVSTKTDDGLRYPIAEIIF